MTNHYRIITEDENGKSRLTPCEPIMIRVRSDQIMPANCPITYSAFIVDKQDVAWSDGKGNWYQKADTPVPAGQPWSALFV